MDRIFHGVTTLICALHDAPTIAYENQLAAIQALHQDIQQWAKLTLPVEKKPHITTPTPTRTRQHYIMRPMRCPNKDYTQDLLPRVVIQKPNASLSPQKVPLTNNDYEPVARCTRSRVPKTVDQPPPRVSKSPDTGTIARHKKSQTATMDNVITPAQAAKRRYLAQVLQSLTIPVLDKTSGQLLKYRQLRKHPSFRTYGTLPMPMNLDDYAKESWQKIKSPREPMSGRHEHLSHHQV